MPGKEILKTAPRAKNAAAFFLVKSTTMKDAFYLNFSTTDNLGIGLFKYALAPQEKFIITNITLAHILGFQSRTSLIKYRLEELFTHPSEYQRFLDAIASDGCVRFFESQFITHSAGPLWVAITASKHTTSRGIQYLEGIIENISHHKIMEDRLAMEKDFLQGLLDNLPDAVYFKDQQNRIIKVNKYYSRGVGLNPDEVIGKTDFDFFSREQAEKMFNDDTAVLQTGTPIIGKIERTLLPDGTWNQAITTKIPMYDTAGKIIGTMGITRDMTEYANLERERLTMLVNALTVVGKTLEMRDPYTFGHMRRVSIIAEAIGKELGWDENRLLGLKLAAELHDLGKMSIPLDILNKPGKLSELEYRFIQEHVSKCYNLIKDIEFPFPLAETVHQHHERLDGSGYPRKLKGEEIITEARILAVSDVLEAMTNHRPYREALGLEAAIRELKEGSGTRYDTSVVDITNHLVARFDNQAFWLNGHIAH